MPCEILCKKNPKILNKSEMLEQISFFTKFLDRTIEKKKTTMNILITTTFLRWLNIHFLGKIVIFFLLVYSIVEIP